MDIAPSTDGEDQPARGEQIADRERADAAEQRAHEDVGDMMHADGKTARRDGHGKGNKPGP